MAVAAGIIGRKREDECPEIRYKTVVADAGAAARVAVAAAKAVISATVL